MGRKHCGKRRNCSLRAISPFPTVFSKRLFPRGVKRCHGVGMDYVQCLTTALARILFSLVVMVLAFSARGHWFESCLYLIFLPCIFSFVSLLQTSSVRIYKHSYIYTLFLTHLHTGRHSQLSLTISHFFFFFHFLLNT